MSINNVTISGNLTRDPQLRGTTSGFSVLNFSVAVNDRRKNKEGEWESYPNFIDCVVIGKRADALNKILEKGMKVCVTGKLHYSSWEDKDTKKTRSKIDVTADEVEIMVRPKADKKQSAEDDNGYYDYR